MMIIITILVMIIRLGVCFPVNSLSLKLFVLQLSSALFKSNTDFIIIIIIIIIIITIITIITIIIFLVV